MTLNSRTLEEYFHVINQPKKELTMFEALKAKWTEFWSQDCWTTKYSWIDQDPEEEQEDGWVFSIRTNSWIDECEEFHPIKDTTVIGSNIGTWMNVLDQILDVLGEHYGYNIKEQVYYSVAMPRNGTNPYTGEPLEGHERSLNDEVLQQLLLAYPEVYDWQGHKEFKL